MFEINIMTLTITGRIGVTTLQITRERSVKKMDTGVIIGLIFAFISGVATCAGVFIGWRHYARDENAQKAKYAPIVKIRVTETASKFTRILVTVISRADFPIYIFELKGINTKISFDGIAATGFFGNNAKRIEDHHDLSPSCEVDIEVPSKESKSPKSSFWMTIENETSSDRSLLLSCKNSITSETLFVRRSISQP